MATDKMDSPAVYALFEELKQKIVEQGRKAIQPDQFTGHALDKSFEKWDKDFSTVTNLVNQIDEKINALNFPQNTIFRKEYVFSLDFRNSKAVITMITMGLVILLSLAGNVWQSNYNSRLKDSDLKYRYVKMQGETNQEELLNLETVFSYNRNKDSISLIRKRVETYERLVKEQSEKIERARLNASEAKRLEKEAESVKSRK
jgi:hypothetical protein